MDHLPFRLHGMTYNDLMEEIEDMGIPSDPESIVDNSDGELQETDSTDNMILMDPEPDSDSEDDLPLSVLRSKFNPSLSLPQSRDWSKLLGPQKPDEFIGDFGITDIVKKIDNPTAGKLFQLFFTDEVLDSIIFQTNLYSQQTSTAPRVTNRQEIKTFLAINLLMGLKRLPSYRDYWSNSPDFHDPYITSLMPVKRFSWILSNLHLNDNVMMPKKGSPGYDKLYKLRPLLNSMSSNFEKCMHPTVELSIDESMIKFKGRSSLKQYLPKKPIKRGYKVWVLADKNGYCQRFQIYTGKSDDSEKSLGARVVKNLLDGLENKHHLVYFDNFFNSVELLEDLKKKNIHACGTVNSNRRLLPDFKGDRYFKRGESEIFTSNTRLVAIKWRDKRSVHLLSNFHDPNDFTEVPRKDKTGVIENVPCPVLLTDYNKNMNFVDKFDQNLNVYKVDRKSKKWWHRIFFYLFDAAIVNAYVLYKELNLPKKTMKEFRREVITFLTTETEIKRRQSTTRNTIAIKKNKPFVPPEIRTSESAHQPTRDTRRRCALCSTSKKQIRTDWVCSVCNVPLCLGKNKTCFQNYHLQNY